MPFNVRKREERRSYYLNRIGTAQNLANQYYNVNRNTVITQTKLRNRTLSRINPSKVKIDSRQYVSDHRSRYPQLATASTRKAVSKHRDLNPLQATASTRKAVSKHRILRAIQATASTRRAVKKYRNSNPEKATASTKRSVEKYRVSNPELNRIRNRLAVSRNYKKNTQLSRALSRTSTARSYVKQLLRCRKKSSKTSKASYKRRAKAFNQRRKQKYQLAEPTQQVMHSVTTRLQDVFVQSEELTDCILEGLRKIPNWNSSPNNVALEHAACKLAASHLVRISLDARRKAVAGLLGVKRDVVDGIQRESRLLRHAKGICLFCLCPWQTRLKR